MHNTISHYSHTNNINNPLTGPKALIVQPASKPGIWIRRKFSFYCIVIHTDIIYGNLGYIAVCGKCEYGKHNVSGCMECKYRKMTQTCKKKANAKTGKLA